jgi:formylglycine-generating enzyme required for sulfatase activity
MGKGVWVFDTTANGYRLPTEAEWEYACRAGTTTDFSFGLDPDLLKAHAWYMGNSKSRTHPVGSKLPNGFGLFDVHGNVDEWCWDWHGPYEGDAVDPVGPPSGTGRVARGGGWYLLVPRQLQSAFRPMQPPNQRSPTTGFRLACGARL